MDPWQTLSGAIAALGAATAGFALARLPRGRVRPPLYAFVLAGVAWVVGDLIADAATNATAKQIGVTILYSGAITIPSLWWLVALRWADNVGADLPLRAAAWRWLPLCWAALMWLAMISNPWHGAFLTPVVGGRNIYPPLWYAHAIPAYALVLTAVALEIGVARRVSRRAVRSQAAFMIAAGGITLGGNLLYVTGALPANPTVIVLSISIALLVVAMAREGLFGVMPTALSAIAAEHPDGIVIVGADGYPGYANQRARELLAPAALDVGRPVIETLRDPQLQPETVMPVDPGSESVWWRALRGPTGLLFQVGGSQRRWIQVTATAIERRGSREGGRLVHVSDATARRQAELHAGQNRRLESVAALARTVSRDFQGAFAIVRSNAEFLENDLLARDPAEDGASQRHLARIFEATSVGADLAHELQLYAGGIHSIRSTLDFSRLVAETCALAESELPHGVGLRVRRTDRLLPVEADPIQIRDCVYNLVTNAIEATAGRGGEIEVITGTECFDPTGISDLVWGRDQPTGDYAYVKIRDEGGGMEPETEERAFEPFFSTRHKDRGNGLSAVLGIARAHHALIAVENDPGWGCTFTLYLPLAGHPSAT